MPALNLNRRKSIIAGVAAFGAVSLCMVAAGSGAFASTAGVSTTSERTGDCGGARYDAEVDREGNGLESNFEIDDAQPGQRWQIQLTQNGEKYFDQQLTADHEGEIDVEQQRTDAAGVDEFVMAAKRLDGPGDCSVTLTR